MATALDSLVQGEIIQLKMEPEKLLDISMYLWKTYYKTASLITNACKSCALLGGHDLDSDVRLLLFVEGVWGLFSFSSLCVNNRFFSCFCWDFFIFFFFSSGV